MKDPKEIRHAKDCLHFSSFKYIILFCFTLKTIFFYYKDEKSVKIDKQNYF